MDNNQGSSGRIASKADAPAGGSADQASRLAFPSIDILRGFAALSVVVYHVIEHFKWTAFPTAGLLVWFRIGWMGVDLFLVISGFVITLSLLSLQQRLSYRARLIEFAHRRVRRIAPLYATTCVFYVVFVAPQLIVHPDFYKHVLAHTGFVHNLNPEYHGSIDGPNWSVGLEVQFYLFYVLLAPWLFRLRWWHVALGAIGLSWTWRAAAIAWIPLDQPQAVWWRFIATTQLPGTLDEFAAGILLARLVHGSSGTRLLAIARRRPVVPVTIAALSVWLLLATFWNHASFWDSAAMVVAWRTACAITFAMVVFAACSLDRPGFIWMTAPLRYLGTISFGIYLWHLPVLLSVQRLEWLRPEQSLWLTIAATLIVAAGSWHLLERPALSRVRQRSCV